MSESKSLTPKVEKGRHSGWLVAGAGLATTIGLIAMDVIGNWNSGEFVWNFQTWDGNEGQFDIVGNVGPSELALPAGILVSTLTWLLLVKTGAYGRWVTETPRTSQMIEKISEGTPKRTWVRG